MKIIGIVGQAGSGKTDAGEHIEKKYGIKLFNTSDILVEEAKKRGLPTKKMDLAQLADKIREEHSAAYIAQRTVDKLKSENIKTAVVTGFRTPEDIDYMRNEVDELLLIWVDADPGIRYERRREKKLNEDEFFARDEDDLKKKHLGKTLLMAEVKIVNDSTEEELFEKVDMILKSHGFV